MTEFARNLALFDMGFMAEFDRLNEFDRRGGSGCLAGFGRQPKK
jgi:hypothetical protein